MKVHSRQLRSFTRQNSTDAFSASTRVFPGDRRRRGAAPNKPNCMSGTCLGEQKRVHFVSCLRSMVQLLTATFLLTERLGSIVVLLSFKWSRRMLCVLLTKQMDELDGRILRVN